MERWIEDLLQLCRWFRNSSVPVSGEKKLFCRSRPFVSRPRIPFAHRRMTSYGTGTGSFATAARNVPNESGLVVSSSLVRTLAVPAASRRLPSTPSRSFLGLVDCVRRSSKVCRWILSRSVTRRSRKLITETARVAPCEVSLV